MKIDTLLRQLLVFGAAASCAMSAAADVVLVSRTITSSLVPVAANNAFVFSFTGLPTTALGAIEVTFFGDADVDGRGPADVGETLTLDIEGRPLGPFGPFDARHFDVTTSFFGVLDDAIADGILNVTINFGAGVDTPLAGDSVSVRLSYEGEVVAGIPTPGSLALAVTGLAGLVRLRRRAGGGAAGDTGPRPGDPPGLTGSP